MVMGMLMSLFGKVTKLQPNGGGCLYRILARGYNTYIKLEWWRCSRQFTLTFPTSVCTSRSGTRESGPCSLKKHHLIQLLPSILRWVPFVFTSSSGLQKVHRWHSRYKVLTYFPVIVIKPRVQKTRSLQLKNNLH